MEIMLAFLIALITIYVIYKWERNKVGIKKISINHNLQKLDEQAKELKQINKELGTALKDRRRAYDELRKRYLDNNRNDDDPPNAS